MKKASSKKEKYVKESSFVKHTDFVSRAFNKVYEHFAKFDEKLDRHDKALTLILHELKEMREERREHKSTMLSLNRTDVSQELEIEGLKVRVERLERKVK